MQLKNTTMKKEMHISLLKKLWNDRHLSVREQLFEYADELSPYKVIHNVLKFLPFIFFIL